MIYIKYTENERFSNTSHTKNHRKLCPQKPQKLSSLNTILRHNLFKFVKVLRRKISSKKTLSKLHFGGKFKDKQNAWIRSWFQKAVLIGQFPSKYVKVFLRKNRMGFYSLKVGQSPSKFFDKVVDAGLQIKELCQRKLWPSFWWKTLIV